jgi:PBP1b-binding outer membrane lipoprotein LpoB
VLAGAVALSGCGYHVAGHSDVLPAKAHTIAIPAFDNLTTRYKLTERIPEAISHEFIARTRYQVIPDVNKADLILKGAITNYVSYPVINVNGRTSVVQMSVFLQLNVLDRQTGKLVYQRPSFEVRQRYEISQDQIAYFEESDIALERLSRDVARTVVSAILESF